MPTSRFVTASILASLLMTSHALAEEEAAEKTTAMEPGAESQEENSEPSAEAKKEAAERFARGLSFYDDGDYSLALIEFERAYQLVPDYRVLYNIGQVSIQLSRSSQALRALVQYLEEGGENLEQDRIDAVKRDLEMLKARTAHLAISGTPGARVIIDDESYGTLPLDAPLLVDAGRHRLEVKLEGYREYTERLTLAGAESRTLSIELEKKPKATPLVATPTPVIQPPPTLTLEPPPPPVEKRPPWAIISWSATGAFATGALVTGVLGLNATSKFKSMKSEPDHTRSELDDQASTAKTLLLAADLLGAAAIATGGVSLYLSFGSSGKSESARRSRSESDGADGVVQLQLAPRSVSLLKTF